MTRQELINTWKEVVSAVFWAKDRLYEEWHDKLMAAANESDDKQREIADQYFEAIATVIASRTSDKELAEMD